MSQFPKRFKALRIAATCAALFISAPAKADPITVFAFVEAALGSTLATAAAIAVSFIETYAATIAVLALNVYGSIDGRRRAAHARQDAVRAYNASLKEVGQISLTSDPDVREVYGTRIVGGQIVAAFSSDKAATRSDGTSYTRPDGYKHLVVVLGKGPMEAIDDVLIAGVSIGTLDSSGNPTSGTYHSTATYTRTVTVGSSGYVDVIDPVAEIISSAKQAVWQNWDEAGADLITYPVLSIGNTRITAPQGSSVVYSSSNNVGTIRVTKYLGSESQAADSFLTGISGGKWTSAHQGKGWAYVVISLDLEFAQFQGGLPAFTFKVRGKKVYDPRLDSTNGGSGAHRFADSTTWAWSQNTALCIADYLHSPLGYRVHNPLYIDWPSVIVAANDCDVTISAVTLTNSGGSRTDSVPQYTTNGVVSSNSFVETALQSLCDAMAGFAVYGAAWYLYAGVWRTPVATLSEDDLDGEISIVQSGTAIDELFNCVNATFVADDTSTPSDINPYKQTTFITADGGEELWTDLSLPFTNDVWHATQLARIQTEQNRNALVVHFPGKFNLWTRQVGERVYVNNAEYGYVNKPFLISNWQFGVSSPVLLTLVEDTSSNYDIIDSVTALSYNPPVFPNPNIASGVYGTLLYTGENEAQWTIDGNVIPRVRVVWNLVNDYYAVSGGFVEITWWRANQSAKHVIQIPATEVQAYLVGFLNGEVINVEMALWNGFVYGPSTFKSIQVLGAEGAYEPVSGLTASTIENEIGLTWNKPAASYWAYTEVRVGSSWSAGSALSRGLTTKAIWNLNVTGTYTFWVKHFSKSRKESATAATVTVAFTAVPTSTSAATTATWAGIPAGTGKAADYATVGATWGGNIGGQPSDAALLNVNQLWAQVGGTGRPADNATVGATWGSNLTGQPSDVALLNINQLWGQVSGTGRPADNATVGADWAANLTSKPADTDLLNTHIQGNVLVVNHPAGANFASNGSGQTGAIKIRLPQSYTDTMLRFFVEVYEYATDKSCTYEVGGYTWPSGSGWLNVYAKMTGSAASEKVVRFGHDGTKCCIWIGEPGSTWDYPQVTVSNFRAGYSSNTAALWAAGWTLSLDTSAVAGHSITQTVTNPLTGANWGQISGSGKPENNATVGATWSVNLSGQPSDAALLNTNQLWSQVGGSGRPADNATVNIVTYSSTAPSSPVNGDMWVDTSVTPLLVKVRAGGAWLVGANYSTNTNQLTDGANLGATANWTGVANNDGNRPAPNATVGATFGVNIGGVMPSTPNIFCVTETISPTVARTGFLLRANGSGVYYNGDISRNIRWHGVGTPSITYYAYLTMTSGPAPTIGAADSYVAITSDIQWSWDRTTIGQTNIAGTYLILDGNSSGANVLGGGPFSGRAAMGSAG